MAIDHQGRRINPGDEIIVTAQGTTVKGIVVSANWFGPSDGWYIEMAPANVPGGYSYWKQGWDGGDVVSVIPKT